MLIGYRILGYRLVCGGLFAALVVGTALSAFGAADKSGYDLRRVRWGMTIDQVRKAEKAKQVYRDTHRLVYTSKVLGRRMVIEYHFARNQLYQATYRLAEEYLLENNYVRDYTEFKEILWKKYGTPKKEEMIWHKPYHKNDPSRWGVAVSIGHLTYSTIWESDTTLIAAVLAGGNYIISCQIEYISKALLHLAQEKTDGTEKQDKGGVSNRKLKNALEEF